MPRIVDHNERRLEYQEAAMRVILRDGLDGATTRAIARESGYSNGVLSHYFTDKDTMMRAVVQMSHDRINARWDRKLVGLRGMAALKELLVDNIPLDDERDAETRLEISMWGRALVSPDLRALQDQEATRLRELALDFIVQAHEDGELAEETNDTLLLERLLALMDGLSVRMLVGPSGLTRDIACQIIEEEVDSRWVKNNLPPSGTR